MRESVPIVLEILRQGQTLKMSIFRHDELALTLRHYSERSVSFLEINKLSQEAIFILNKAGKKTSDDEGLIKGLTKAGQLLWQHLFTRQVKEKLKSLKNLDLILSMDEELITIPWELLHDGNNFLCLKFNIGRVIRTKEQIAQPQYRSPSSPLKMLILANPTNDLKSAYQEGINIKNQFDRKRSSVHIDFKSTDINKMYVKKNLNDYDIVHFAGHAEFQIDEPDNSGWLLSDGRLTIGDILAMGQTLTLPALVFSNACHSAETFLDLIDLDYQEKNYSLASAFLFSGVRHYIGAVGKIEDIVSMTFSKEFYTQLISGAAVGESVRLGRLKLAKEYGIAAFHWSSYLLYGDPGFVLFRAKTSPQAPDKKRAFLLYRKIGSKKQLAWLSLAGVLISISVYLYLRLPSINPNTYRLFLSSKRLSQEGANQKVILQCSQIIKKEPLFQAAYPLLAETFNRLGDKENALKYYFAYALLCEKKGDKKNLTFAYVSIGWVYHLFGEYPKAYDFYNKAVSLSKENNDTLNEAIVLRKLAVWHMDKQDYDKALELLTKSSQLNRERQAKREYRYNLACDYFDIGLVFANKNDFAAARDFYNRSRALFERLELKEELSDYYFNLGEICLFEKQYQKALAYYLRGLKIDEDRDNKMNIAGDYNMIGELYLQMDNLTEAQSFFNRSSLISEAINAKIELASANYNLGVLYRQKGQKKKAREYLLKAGQIYSQIDTPDYEDVKQELLTLDK